MEIITTQITIETDNPKKGYAEVDRLIKEGYSHESTNVKPPMLDEARYIFVLNKMEHFNTKVL